MTTLTNSEGLVITYANELLETIVLQLIPSNNCYTSGEHYITFVQLGFNNYWF